MRPPRRPGETVADLALFGPLIASAVLAAYGHDTTSTCLRTTWRRYVLAGLAVHACINLGPWDPLGRVENWIRSTTPRCGLATMGASDTAVRELSGPGAS